MTKTSKVLAELTKEVSELKKLLQDPQAVYINMLRGDIAKPSVEQIKHIYGLASVIFKDNND